MKRGDDMWNAPVDTVQIEVPRRLFRAMHWRPLNLLIVGLTGVSVSFCPLFLYWLGRDGADITDWRVLANFAVIFLVPGVFMSFGAPVLVLAGKRAGLWGSASDDAGRSRHAMFQVLFWLLVAAVGAAIWVASDWFMK